MHELGVLCQIVKKVNHIAQENKIQQVKHITLEVGEASSFVPVFLEKLFPVAVENFPAFQKCELKIEKTTGKGLVIKDIGY
jgi:hydrogenase nickel incorporation protein HypA/HybF